MGPAKTSAAAGRRGAAFHRRSDGWQQQTTRLVPCPAGKATTDLGRHQQQGVNGNPSSEALGPLGGVRSSRAAATWLLVPLPAGCRPAGPKLYSSFILQEMKIPSPSSISCRLIHTPQAHLSQAGQIYCFLGAEAGPSSLPRDAHLACRTSEPSRAMLLLLERRLGQTLSP